MQGKHRGNLEKHLHLKEVYKKFKL